jgi:hypothetical protein
MRPTLPALLLALSLAFGATAQPIAPLDNQEPRPGVVREREAAVGLAPDAQQSRSEQKGVDQLYRELTGTSPAAPAPAMPLGPPIPQEAGAENQLYRELTGSAPQGSTPSR